MHEKVTEVAAGILIRPNGEFLLASRPQGKPYAGWWEFPGGKLEAGESAREALLRELHEEMGIAVHACQPWVVQSFSYPHAKVRLNFFKVSSWEGELQAREGQAFAWQSPGSLNVEPVLPANAPILRGLQLPATLLLSNVAEMGQAAWLAALRAKLGQGPLSLILREPELAPAAYLALAQQVQAILAGTESRLFIHGHLALAGTMTDVGQHLSARQLLNCASRPAAWCGASVHNAQELAKAQELALDYVVLGSVQASLSHPGGSTLGWVGFEGLLQQGWAMPVYAIGGMAEQDVTKVQAMGGQGVALLRGAWR